MVVTTLPGPNRRASGQVQEIAMDVNHVEFVRAAPQLLELQRGVDQRFPDGRVQTQRASERPRAAPPTCTESPLANSVTSWPWRTSSSVRYETMRSVPP